MIEISPIPAFSDNYIWIIENPENRHIAIVDPGDAQPVLTAIEKHGWIPTAILITHHHADHVGGIREITRHYDIPVYGPSRENIVTITDPLEEDDEVELGSIGAHFRVLFVPGHTRGHIAYYGHNALFCGDTLFTAGCGRLFEGTPEQMHQSLEKLSALPEKTRVYCAHEYTLDNLGFAIVVEPDNPDLLKRIEDTKLLRSQNLPSVPSTIELELKTNPFLRCKQANVIAAAENFSSKSLQSGSEIFAVVRYWKDTLD
jgi:hydroxyacylglutathione hydrolase